MSNFTNTLDISGIFASTELDTGVDFHDVGDQGAIITEDVGWGDEPWGDEPWGGTQTTILSSPTTPWTNIDTP